MSGDKTCNDWQDLLPAYQKDRLDAAERADLTAHLATCANCQRALANWRTLTATLQAAAQAVPPPPSDAALWAALGPRVRAEGGHATVIDAPSRNGHHPTESVAGAVPLGRAPRSAPAVQGRPSRGAAAFAAVVVVALLVALFGALAARRGATTPAQPTATPIAFPSAFSIPGNLLATAAIGGTDFWIGGNNLLASYDGHDGWTQITIPPGSIVESISMVTPTEGWAVGYTSTSEALLLHDHGGTWQVVTPTFASGGLQGVQMASADEGWAWNSGTLLRYQSGTWTSQDSPFAQSFIAILAVVGPGEVWVSSDHTLWHFHSGTWTAEGDLGTDSVSDISMVSPTEGWASGFIGGLKHTPVVNDLWHYDGKAWSRVTPAPDILNDHAYGIDQLFIHNHTDGWAALVSNDKATTPDGLDGYLLRYHQGQWSLVAIPPGMRVQRVLTVGPDNAWAIASDISGQHATFVQLLHYQGGVWHTK